MRPHRVTWPGNLAVMGGPFLSVGMVFGLGPLEWGAHHFSERWVLDWGVGFFFALCVLGPLGWRRQLSYSRRLVGFALSLLSWHWAVGFASAAYSPVSTSWESLLFLGRSGLAGALGAAAVALAPLAGREEWERRLGVIAAAGGMCGTQMGLLCLWKFDYGFWLGLLGWQFAVTAILLVATGKRSTKSLFAWTWPQITRP